MRRRKNGTTAYYEAYMCGSYSRSGHTACTTHYISLPVLTELVTLDFWNKADAVCENEKEVIRQLVEATRESDKMGTAALQKSARTLKKRLAELDRLIQSTYEDKVLGKIPEDICVKLLSGYQSEQEEKTGRLKEMEAQLQEDQKLEEGVQKWTEEIRKFRDCDTLTRDMLLKLIDRIEVGETVDSDGTKERHITIHYRYFRNIGGSRLTVPMPGRGGTQASG